MICLRTWPARLALIVACSLLGAGRAGAGLIVTRADLDATLAGSGASENFEGFTIASGSALSLGIAYLDSTVTVAGQGPGLVVPNVNFQAASDDPGNSTVSSLVWNGNAYFGLSTKTLAVSGSDLTIGFTPTTTAFGVDLKEYTGFGDTITATVYAPDDMTPLATPTVITVAGPSPVFFGYSDAGGIGGVTFSATNGSPVIDNLEFAKTLTAVPEPSTLVGATLGALLVAAAFWRRQRRARAA